MKDLSSQSLKNYGVLTDWSNLNHKRCIAASLVWEVKVLEFNRQERRFERDALADKWWTFFDFQLVEKATEGKTIVGAVYKWSGEARPTEESFPRDIYLDLQILINGLHTTHSFQTTLHLVEKYVSSHNDKNVWIVGHSLGAAIAMLVGRHMAKHGYLLQAHLFNPSFPSFSSILPEKIKSSLGKIYQPLLNYGNCDEHGLSETEKAFVTLNDWFPCLYVNNNDKFCSGYVEYFNQTVQATWVSIKQMLLSAIGIDSKAAHFIPSATLMLNLIPSTDLKSAHMIYQWFAPDLTIECKPISLSPHLKIS